MVLVNVHTRFSWVQTCWKWNCRFSALWGKVLLQSEREEADGASMFVIPARHRREGHGEQPRGGEEGHWAQLSTPLRGSHSSCGCRCGHQKGRTAEDSSGTFQDTPAPGVVYLLDLLDLRVRLGQPLTVEGRTMGFTGGSIHDPRLCFHSLLAAWPPGRGV